MSSTGMSDSAGIKRGGITIRRGIEADFPGLKRVLQETFESTWLPEITPAAARNYVEGNVGHRFVDEQGRNFLVALVGGEVAGLVNWRDDFIDALHVGSRHQRLGVGRALMRALEAELARRGCPKLNLQVRGDNRDVVAFYQRLGYRVEDRVSMGRVLAAELPPEE